MTRKILLVSPAFQGYWRAVERALQSKGWVVNTYIYDQPGAPAARVANMVAHATSSSGIAQRMNSHLSDLAVRKLRDARPDAILVMRGDQLSTKWWEAVRDENVPVVTWAYDEVRRMRPDFTQNASVGAIATYSAPDAKRLIADGYNAFHLPLAFDAHSPVIPSTYPAVTFIGARYPNREAQLAGLHTAGVPVIAFGKTWSSSPIDQIRSRNFQTLGFRTGPNLGRPEAYGVMAGSLATLNMHGDQEGFTMRTFEAAGVGGVQLIDRDDVSDFYTPGDEVLTFSNDDELLELSQRISRGSLRTQALRAAAKKRTMAEHTFDHRIATLLNYL